MSRDGTDMAVDATGVRPNGSTPRCRHLDALSPVTPHSSFCLECRAAGEHSAELVMCLTCGWVACSDDSHDRHALAHYEETDHPVVRALRPGSTWKWCYVHRRAV
jgi:uncharacterized UBP type Zn finger protein